MENEIFNTDTSALKDVTKGEPKINLDTLTENAAPGSQPFDLTGNKNFNPLQPAPQQQQNMNLGQLVGADIVANVMNVIIPTFGVILIKNIAKKQVSKKQLQATESEKAAIKPVLQNYLNSINFNLSNPLNALVITVVAIYGAKTIEILNTPGAVVDIEQPKTNSQGLQHTSRQAANAGRKPGKGEPSRYMQKKYGSKQP